MYESHGKATSVWINTKQKQQLTVDFPRSLSGILQVLLVWPAQLTSFNRRSRPKRNCVVELKMCSIPSAVDPSTKSASSNLVSSNPNVSEIEEGIVTGCRCSMYGVDMETKFTLFWGSDSLDLLECENRDKAKSSRPRRIYAAAGQSVGGDSRHLSNAYEMQNTKIILRIMK